MNNKTTRKLKYAEWSYDFDTNKLNINIKDRTNNIWYSLEIDKPYVFSLGRFLISVWQKLSSSRRNKKVKK